MCAPYSVGKQKEKNNKNEERDRKAKRGSRSRIPTRVCSARFQLLFLVSVPGTKSQPLFVAPETLSELTEGLMFSDCGRMSLQPLRVVGGEKILADRTEGRCPGNRNFECAEGCRAPESRSCIHGHTRLLNAKLIVILSLPEMI